jgi:DNA-binding CsgD family transcriptional regulator/tetratricopeptide (TPR) repeat protein
VIANPRLPDLIALAAAEYPEARFDFLDEAIFSISLTSENQQHYLRLLSFIRQLQLENPLYETVYQHLLHLYVLNGSRLEALKTIERRLRGVVEGQSAIMLVSGISGIGKTSIVLAFQERIHQLGAAFISAHCYEHQSTSYALWQDVARSAASQTNVSIDTLLAPIGQGKDARSSLQLRQALADFFSECAAGQPLVILLDDLHWCDADSLEVLDHLSSRPVHSPILYIATYRSEESHSPNPLNDFLPKLRRDRLHDTIHLSLLSEDDIERLVTAYHGPCSTQLVAYLLERAEGHPLFTIELLNDLIVHNLLRQDEAGCYLPPEESIPVPAFLKQLIKQHVNRAGIQVEKLLSIGAVAGESWQLKIVEKLLDMPEKDLFVALESALRAEIITIEDEITETYRFSHGLFREVLYYEQLTRLRKRLHEQVAVQYEQQQPDNHYAIAYHYLEAQNWEKAIHYCLLAGQQATRRLASYSVIQWYQRALEAAQHAGADFDSIRMSIYEQLGRAYMVIEQRDLAEIAYNRMRELAQNCGDLVAEGHALVDLSLVIGARNQLDLAEKTAYQALRIGEQSDDLKLLTRIHACLAKTMIARGRFEEATFHNNQALHHAEAFEDVATMSEIFRQYAYQSIWLGQYQEAETYARWAFKYAQKDGDPLLIVGGYQILSYILIEAGKYTEAYRLIRNILEESESSDPYHHQLPRLLNQMGYLYLELGDAQEALSWDQKALQASQNSPEQRNYEMQRYSLLNIATDNLHLRKLDEVQDAITQFEAVNEGREFGGFRYLNRYQLLRSELNLVQNEPERAIELAQEARVMAQSKDILKNIARSHWLEGRALDKMMHFDEALKHLQEATAIVDRIKHGSLRWKIRLSRAEVLTRSGKSSQKILQEARLMLDQTLHSLSLSHHRDILINSHWVKQLAALEKNPLPEKPAYPAGLTEREIEVLRLVASGATNQHVANVLHISVRTVNTHMTNILNKTGCDNRTAASAFAIQNNLVSK